MQHLQSYQCDLVMPLQSRPQERLHIYPCVGSFTSHGIDTRYCLIPKTQAMVAEQTCPSFEVHLQSLSYHRGPFKCYVTLFFWKLDPHPPPRNANNIEHHTFVTLFSRKSDTHPPPSALHLNDPILHNRYTVYKC